jgi:hypothetical protein
LKNALHMFLLRTNRYHFSRTHSCYPRGNFHEITALFYICGSFSDPQLWTAKLAAPHVFAGVALRNWYSALGSFQQQQPFCHLTDTIC